MQLKEFLDLTAALTPDKFLYLKPVTKPQLNGYHPDFRHKIFQITLPSVNNYKVRYITVMQEITCNKVDLEKMFYAKNWQDFIFFDLVEDFNEWQKDHS